MPKILRIINRFNLGGPTYNVAYLTKYISSDYETLLIGGDKEPGEDSSTFILENLGIKPVILPELRRDINLLNDRAAYRKIKEIIKDYKPDIVHTHASKSGTIGRLAAVHSKVPVIVHTFHGHVFHSYFNKAKTEMYKNIERYLARKSSAIVAISAIQKEELTNEHRITEPSKVHIIPLGFDLNRFNENKAAKRENFRNKFKIKEDELVIMIIGRLAPVKNHPFFIDGVIELCKNKEIKVKAVIVGDGELKQNLKNYINEKGSGYWDVLEPFENQVFVFTSWITNADWALAGSDIVALTSLNEGTPVSLIEAQAAGKPIVTTDTGGIRDITSDDTAIVVEQGNLEQLSQAFKTICYNEDKRERMGSAGWDLVSKKFHYTRLVKDMEQLYTQLRLKL